MKRLCCVLCCCLLFYFVACETKLALVACDHYFVVFRKPDRVKTFLESITSEGVVSQSVQGEERRGEKGGEGRGERRGKERREKEREKKKKKRKIKNEEERKRNRLNRLQLNSNEIISLVWFLGLSILLFLSPNHIPS
jgi:hypothetical protein